MKKNVMILFLTLAVSTAALWGCGRTDTNDNNNNAANRGEVAGTEAITNENAETENNTTSQLQLGNAVEIPQGFTGELAETDAHGALEQVIAQYCNISEENYANVRYYYNYVDLNGDTKKEILALVLEENAKELEGNTLLWINAENENFTKDSVIQSFTKVGAPIYISNHMTEGYRDLIVTNENKEPEAMEHKYTKLIWNGGRYQDIHEGEAVEDLADYEGTAILTNNMESDFANDNYHFLGEAM